LGFGLSELGGPHRVQPMISHRYQHTAAIGRETSFDLFESHNRLAMKCRICRHPRRVAGKRHHIEGAVKGDVSMHHIRNLPRAIDDYIRHRLHSLSLKAQSTPPPSTLMVRPVTNSFSMANMTAAVTASTSPSRRSGVLRIHSLTAASPSAARVDVTS